MSDKLRPEEEVTQTKLQLSLSQAFDRLPAMTSGEQPSITYLSDMGFEIEDQSDPYVVKIRPPSGWELRPSEKSKYHLDIYDSGQNQRGAIFVHFNDMSRWKTHLLLRFLPNIVCLDRNGNIIDISLGTEPTSLAVTVYDRLKESNIFFDETIFSWDRGSATFKALDHRKAAVKWLRSKFPKWENPAAYWGR